MRTRVTVSESWFGNRKDKSELFAIDWLQNDIHQVIDLDEDGELSSVLFQGSYVECREWLSGRGHTAWLE